MTNHREALAEHDLRHVNAVENDAHGIALARNTNRPLLCDPQQTPQPSDSSTDGLHNDDRMSLIHSGSPKLLALPIPTKMINVETLWTAFLVALVTSIAGGLFGGIFAFYRLIAKLCIDRDDCKEKIEAMEKDNTDLRAEIRAISHGQGLMNESLGTLNGQVNTVISLLRRNNQ